MLVALVKECFGRMFALHFHAKMHLRLGSKAVDTGSYGGDSGWMWGLRRINVTKTHTEKGDQKKS